MRTMFSSAAAVIVSALVLPVAVFAQEAGPPALLTSSFDTPTDGFARVIEIGAAPQESDSFMLGRYTGAVSDGAFGVANFAIRHRDAFDSGRTGNWELLGNNLGLTSRSLAGKYGQQGAFNVSFAYNQIPFYQSDSAASIFSNPGSATLSLPVGVPLNTTAALGSQLTPFLHPQAFEMDRKIVSGAFSAMWSSGWQVTTNVSRERKTGLKEQSMSVNVRTDPVAFPEPMAYDTNAFDAAAAYNTRKLQLQLGYAFSDFSNDNTALLLPSPYVGVAGQGVGAISQWALPVGNTAHDVNLTVGYNIGHTTRVNANLGYGLQLQNEPLLPYTRNAAFKTEPLPLQSLDGRVRTSLAQFKISMQPTARFDLSAAYTYDDRRNETPREEWTSLMEPEWDDIINWNVPYGFTDQNARIDAGYRLPTRTRITAGYQHQVRDRTYAEVLTNRENSGRVKVTQDYKIGSAYVSYLYSNRTGSPYNAGGFDFAQGNLPPNTPLLPYPNNAPQANGYLLEPNYYLFRRVFEADRTRHETKLGTTIDIVEGVSLDVSGRRTVDDYPNSQFGVQGTTSWTSTADLAFAVATGVEFHGFYTRESFLNDQQSLGSAGIVTNTPTPQWTWQSAYQDVVDTYGVGASFAIGRLTLGPRYQRSVANTDINVTSGRGSGVSAQWMSMPIPTIATRSYGAKLVGEYALPQNALVRIVYDYEDLTTHDPMLNTGPLPIAQTLYPTTGPATMGWLVGGDASGLYHIQIITASLIWRF